MTKVSDILVGAKEKVKRRECWGTGHYHQCLAGGVDAFCALGAINSAAYDLLKSDYCEKLIAAIKWFREANNIISIATWNDTEGRTHEEVVESFKAAIAYALEQEKEEEQFVKDVMSACGEEPL